MEEYLCELIQRKCRVPHLVEKEFVARSFSWKMLDKKILVGESVKGAGTRFPTRVLPTSGVPEAVAMCMCAGHCAQ